MATPTATGRSPFVSSKRRTGADNSLPSELARTQRKHPVWQFSLGLLLLYATQPAVCGIRFPPFWFPSAGIAFTLVAWFGRRFALAPLLAGILAAITEALSGSDHGAILDALADGAAAAIEALAGSWFYLALARGGRRLSDPRSAVEFLLLVPGAAALFGASARGALVLANDPQYALADFSSLWLGHALGMLVVAPPVMVGFTPLLVRRGLTHEDAPDAAPLLPGPVGADRLTTGDAIEIAGLALCAGGLGLLLALSPGHRFLAGWQTWGAPLLLIVWSSLRQGLLGGTTVAAAAVAVPLAVLARTGSAGSLALLLQGNLLAQASTGLLVAASASWLRSSERRYRQLVAHVPVVVYSVRLTGDPPMAEVTLVSAASGALLGCPPDQFLGYYSRWLDHVHPVDREVLNAALTQLERQPEPVTCEYRLAPVIPEDWNCVQDPAMPRSRTAGAARPSSTAGIRWVRDTLAPQRDQDGRLTGWEGVLTDITEQRTLADDLRRTSSMLHALVNNLPAGVFFVQGTKGRPILVNARARQLLGQREDAVLAHVSSVYRLHRPDATPYPVDELPVTQALRDGRTMMCDDIVVHRPDGRRVPLVTWAAPVQLTGAEPDAAVWVLEDLTALHQAEAARRETEGRLRAVVETMGEALVVLGRNGEIVDANQAAANLFVSDHETLLGQTLAELGWEYTREDGEPLDELEHPVSVTLRTGRPVRGLLIGLRCKGGIGAKKWVLVNAMPLGSPPAGVVATLTDLTQYQHYREVARASEARFRAIIDTLPLAVILFDADLCPTYGNRALLHLTGYSLSEIASPRDIANKLHADDLSEVRSLADSALAGTSVQGDCRIRAGDGSEKRIHLFLEPQRDGEQVTGLTVMMAELSAVMN